MKVVTRKELCGKSVSITKPCLALRPGDVFLYTDQIYNQAEPRMRTSKGIVNLVTGEEWTPELCAHSAVTKIKASIVIEE